MGEATRRVVVALVAGVLGALATIAAGGAAGLAPVLGWVVAAATFLAWTWAVIGPMDADATRAHATAETPGRRTAHGVLVLASLASLAGVGYLLAQTASADSGAAALAPWLGVCSVAAAWVVVHTVYTVRYADLYYRSTPRCVDFNQDEPPRYSDFAYLAFSIGMTYQVSDTDLRGSPVRAAALLHALLSYLLGAVVLAVTINLVVDLASTSA